MITPEANSSVRFLPPDTLYSVHAAGICGLTLLSCLFPICNVLIHLWAMSHLQMLHFCLYYLDVQSFDDGCSSDTHRDSGRESVLFTWVSNSSMRGASENIHSIISTTETPQWAHRMALTVGAAPFLILETIGFWNIPYPPVSRECCAPSSIVDPVLKFSPQYRIKSHIWFRNSTIMCYTNLSCFRP